MGVQQGVLLRSRLPFASPKLLDLFVIVQRPRVVAGETGDWHNPWICTDKLGGFELLTLQEIETYTSYASAIIIFKVHVGN